MGLLTWLTQSLAINVMEDDRVWLRSGMHAHQAGLPHGSWSLSAIVQALERKWCSLAVPSYSGDFQGCTPWQCTPISTQSTTVELPCGKGKYGHWKLWGKQQGGKLRVCTAEEELPQEEVNLRDIKTKVVLANSAAPSTSDRQTWMHLGNVSKRRWTGETLLFKKGLK